MSADGGQRTAESALGVFDPRVREWFAGRYGAPTEIQALAWPRIAAGEHVLLTAPTGSGKTLTAFLWALDRLATGTWEPGTVRALYVSPLKALGNDIRRNLLEPLEGLRLPDVRVSVRSGDTPPSERRRMLQRPPEILVTTPESLNLLLASHGGRSMLGGVRTVILDEIHAVAGNKRGAYLMTAVERLVPLSGEFQRIALSATVEPLAEVASLVGGVARTVATVRSAAEKKLELTVRSVDRPEKGSSWPALTAEFRTLLAGNRSTLFFVNNRALSEKLARWLNDEANAPVAYAHHGSLSREIRELVEARLKEGALQALVATSSLELGIDIGSLDEVVLVQSPKSIHSAIQRLGRAGHTVGETSRGRIYPTYGRDFLEACVLAPLVEAGAVEPVRPPKSPLDVLAQVLLAMCGVEERDLDETYALLRRSWPYRDLKREAFDRVVAMLRGRYADVRLRELQPRLRIDPATGRARAARGVLPIVWRSGGVIPDRGYFTIRVQGSGARLGELDEEFVWERRPGDTFTIGAQTWRLERVTKSDVEVSPAAGARAMAPFWRAEAMTKEFAYCERIGRFLEAADRELESPAFRDRLLGRHRMDEGAADQLLDFLRRQRAVAPLPHRTHLLVERYAEGDAKQILYHATWGGRVLRPLGLAVAAAWEERFGTAPDLFTNDDCLLLHVPHDAPEPRLLDLVAPESVERLVRRRLDRSGFFGSRFRESAARALLLPRGTGQRRMPLWLNRLRAKKLLEAVRGASDFPIVAEAWRECLEDEFDLPALARLLEEVRDGRIRTSEVRTTRPSPFAEGVVWRSTSEYMYGDDAPLSTGPSLADEVLAEVLHDSALRPKLDPELVAAFEAKLQRTAPGYEPEDDAERVDLVAERLLVPPWTDAPPPGVALVDWGRGWAVPASQQARLERARAGDEAVLAECVAEFLRTHGPVREGYLAECWGVPVAAALARLVEDGRVVAGRLRRDAAETEYCDVENLERLLRLSRAAARPAIEPRPLDRLPLFLATTQGLVPRGSSLDDLRPRLEALFGYPAPAAAWEEALLPARLAGYRPEQLDELLRESDLVWIGAGRERLLFCFRDDARLFAEPSGPSALLPEAYGRFDFFDLQKRAGLDSSELTQRLWAEAWEGRVVNDTFAAVRRGLATRFRAEKAAPRRRAGWQSSRPLLGHWESAPVEPAGDALDAAEDDRERARRLLLRYGVLFRELCASETPLLGWGRLVRALRLMELSGEIVSGHFFRGVDGLQFASHDAVRRLQAPLDDAAVWWASAIDPASGCGVVPGLPARLPGTWIVYRGAAPAMVLHRGGRRVELRGEPAFEVFDEMVPVTVEEIDGAPAARSPHAAAFLAHGFERDMDRLVLRRSYG